MAEFVLDFSFSIYGTSTVKYLTPITLNIFTDSITPTLCIQSPLAEAAPSPYHPQMLFFNPLRLWKATTDHQLNLSTWLMCVQIDVIVLGTMMQQFPITVLKGESYISVSLPRLCVVWPMPLVGKAGFDFHVDEIMSFLRVCGQLTSS